MWVHVLKDRSLAAFINERFIPVRVCATDSGLPRYSGIERFAREYAKNPWHHFFYSHFLATDASGTVLLGGTGCQANECHAREDDRLGRFRARLTAFSERDARLRAARAAKDDAAIAGVRSEVDREIDASYSCLHDRRVVTVRALLLLWPHVRRHLTPPRPGAKDHLEPGVRALAIDALGTLLTDDRPFDPHVADHLAAIRPLLEPEDEAIVRRYAAVGGLAAIRLPPGIRRRALLCLADAFGASVETVDSHLESRVIAHWRAWREERRKRRDAPKGGR